MNYADLTAGKNPPEDINAIIEIPAYSPPVKYEVDKDIGLLMVDRFLSTAMFYPCNYGFIPKTLSEDGDPLDIMVLTPIPVVHGSLIRCRPIGLLTMSDEAGIDSKILAVPVNKLTSYYSQIKNHEDLPPGQLAAIINFFENYKALEPGKWVKVEEWKGVKEAQSEILSCIKRFK